MNNNDYDVRIIVYGTSCNDQKIFDKYTQLKKLGFVHVFFVYWWIMGMDITTRYIWK